MKVQYKELNRKVSGDLHGVNVSRVADGKLVSIQDSSFVEIPQGSRARLKAISFSKLEVGDFILISTEGQMTVRRFLRLDMTKGSTRLVVADGAKQEEPIPFTRLVGRIECVRRDECNVNPNPQTFLQRLAFRFTYRFLAA